MSRRKTVPYTGTKPDTPLGSREFEALFESAPDGMLVVDRNADIVATNRQMQALSGYEAHELQGFGLDRIVPARFHGHRQLVAEYLRSPALRAMGHGKALSLRHRSGAEIPVEISLAPIDSPSGTLVAASVRDISARQQLERDLASSESRLAAIADAIPGAVCQFSVSGDGRIRFEFFSRGLARMLEIDLERVNDGFDLEQILEFVHPDDRDDFKSSLESEAAGGHAWSHEFRIVTANNRVRWVRGSATPHVSSQHGRPVWNGLLTDSTETRALSDELARQANHDPLTGLTNRRAFERLLDQVLSGGRHDDAPVSVAYIDLDQFKVVNDTCGHVAGDELLRQLAELLDRHLRANDTLARLGGDEFAVIMRGSDVDGAAMVMERIRAVVADYRFVWDGRLFRVGASIGLVPVSNTGMSVSDVLKYADAACYAAKDGGRNRVHIFEPASSRTDQGQRHMSWVPHINQALEDDGFELFAQPIVSLAGIAPATHRYEILVRMRLASGQLVMPGAFLPAAERFNLAPQLDYAVIDKLFEWLVASGIQQTPWPKFNINLSGLTVSHPEVALRIADRVMAADIDPSAICFEITETAAISNLSQAADWIEKLHAIGCSFALDDFGTGVSSFAQLRTLHVDCVKIDGMFIKDLSSGSADLTIVKAMNDMVHAMGMETVAEFVENSATLELLREAGVDFAQGYAIGVPMPIDALMLPEVRLAKTAQA